MKSSICRAIAISSLWLGTLDVSAAIITFNLSYSGTSFGNSAIGTGTVSFDDTVLINEAVDYLGNVSAEAIGIVDFTISISGADSGNGTFGLDDFSTEPNGWVWVLSAPVDLGSELVGQPGFLDFNWCARSLSCGNPVAPGGSDPLLITTNGETGDTLAMISMAPTAVPIPAAVWLFGSGLLGLVGIARRRRKTPFPCRQQQNSRLNRTPVRGLVHG